MRGYFTSPVSAKRNKLTGPVARRGNYTTDAMRPQSLKENTMEALTTAKFSVKSKSEEGGEYTLMLESTDGGSHLLMDKVPESMASKLDFGRAYVLQVLDTPTV